MEKSGLKLDTLQMREKDFDMKSELFALIAETEERDEYNAALQDMSQLLREAAQGGDVMHAIRLERQCIALDQSRRPDRIDELNRQLLKSNAAKSPSCVIFFLTASSFFFTMPKRPSLFVVQVASASSICSSFSYMITPFLTIRI